MSTKNGLNYIAHSNDPKGSQPKLFTFTQSVNQLENQNQKQSPFRPMRGIGRSSGHTGSQQPLFPALLRFQNANQDANTNVETNYKQQREHNERPLFSLLNSTHHKTSPVALKHEPASSDKTFSPSPPPHGPHVTPKNPGSAIGIGLSQSQPHQMLPPPPPPQAPDSRPPSPAPRPRSRSTSRSRSSLGLVDGMRMGELGQDEASMDGDIESIAINALRGVRAANAELGEERRRSHSLLSQLNTLTTTHESIRAQHTSTSSELRSSRAEIESLKNELCALRGEREEEIASLKNEASLLRDQRDQAICLRKKERERLVELKGVVEELGISYSELKTAFVELKDVKEKEMKAAEDNVRETRKWAEERLTKIEPLLDDDTCLAKEARTVIGGLEEELGNSRRVIDLLRDKLHHLSSVLAESQGKVRELEEAEHVSKERAIKELKGVREEMKEIMGKLESAQDLRIEEVRKLLNEKEEACVSTTTALENLRTERIELGCINDGLVNRLAESEQKLRQLSQDLSTKEKELEVSRKAGEETESRLAVLQERFDAQTITLRFTKEQVCDLQERIQASSVRIQTTEDDLLKTREALESTRAALVAKNLEMEKAIRDSMDKVNELKEVEIRATRLQGRCSTLEEEIGRVREVCEGLRNEERKKSEELRDVGAQSMNLKERCLVLSKEVEKIRSEGVWLRTDNDNLRKESEKLKGESATRADELKEAGARATNMQERCSVLGQEVEKVRAEMEWLRIDNENLRKDSEKLRVECAIHAEELRQALVDLTKVQGQADIQATSLKQEELRYALLENKMNKVIREKTEEIDKTQREWEETREGLHQADRKTSVLQEQVNSLTASLNQTQGWCSDLRKSNVSLAEELSTSQSALEEARQEILQRSQDSMRLVKLCERIEEQRASDEIRRAERVTEEYSRVRELEGEVGRLMEEGKTLREELEKRGRLRERHEQNELSDEEKDFVEWLMRLAASLHDEEDVVKANELRRKENFIVQLQKKIRELESSLAHLIKEKEQSGGVSKSMIDIDAFMTSSPCSSDPQPTVVLERGPTVSKCVPTTTDPLQPVRHKPDFLPFKPAPVALVPTAKPAVQPAKAQPLTGLSFSSLEESDSEEDIPLSEVSAAKTKSVLGKRDRVPSPANPQQQTQQGPTSNPSPISGTYQGRRRLRPGRTVSGVTQTSPPPISKAPPTKTSQAVQKKPIDGKPKKKRK